VRTKATHNNLFLLYLSAAFVLYRLHTSNTLVYSRRFRLLEQHPLIVSSSLSISYSNCVLASSFSSHAAFGEITVHSKTWSSHFLGLSESKSCGLRENKEEHIMKGATTLPTSHLRFQTTVGAYRITATKSISTSGPLRRSQLFAEAHKASQSRTTASDRQVGETRTVTVGAQRRTLLLRISFETPAHRPPSRRQLNRQAEAQATSVHD
jgi:hypothetical protein